VVDRHAGDIVPVWGAIAQEDFYALQIISDQVNQKQLIQA
jgi:hypothetical protein